MIVILFKDISKIENWIMFIINIGYVIEIFTHETTKLLTIKENTTLAYCNVVNNYCLLTRFKGFLYILFKINYLVSY